MKIGIDAKSFYSGPVSTTVILQNIIPKLIEQNPLIDWVIFLDKKDKDFNFPFKQKNVRVEYVWANINQLSNLFVLPRYLKKHSIDLVVYQMFPSFISSTPAIAFIHDVLFRQFPEFFTWKEKMYFFPISLLTRKATRLITTTNSVARDLVKYNYTRDASLIDIVPLGVSENFKPREEHDKEFLKSIKSRYKLPERFLLFVGRLNIRKNISNLLKALLLLKDREIHLVIVGERDWKAPHIDHLLLDPEIERRLIFTGRVTVGARSLRP